METVLIREVRDGPLTRIEWLPTIAATLGEQPHEPRTYVEVDLLELPGRIPRAEVVASSPPGRDQGPRRLPRFAACPLPYPEGVLHPSGLQSVAFAVT
jgi:hypothetical protein